MKNEIKMNQCPQTSFCNAPRVCFDSGNNSAGQQQVLINGLNVLFIPHPEYKWLHFPNPPVVIVDP